MRGESIPDAPTGHQPWNWRAPLGISTLFLCLHAFYLSPRPFWIDASAYADIISQGARVIQPPGYLVFIEIIRILSGWFGHAFQIQQAITLASTVAAIFVLHRALEPLHDGRRATGFAAAFAFSWLTLNLGSAGTTHALDFLFSSLWILLLTHRQEGKVKMAWHLAFFLVFAAAGSIRLTSAIMAGPLVLLVLLFDWRHRSFWLSAMVAAIILGIVQFLTIRAYGGMPAFRAASEGSHAMISHSSILFGGNWPNVAVNCFRAGFWIFMLCPVLLIALVRRWKSWPRLGTVRFTILGCLMMMAGTIFVTFGYLCTHPGYLTPLLTPFLYLVASVPGKDELFRRIVAVHIILSLSLFFTIRPKDGPGSKWMAAANAYLLQFGAHNHRYAIPMYSLSGWLAITGNLGDIPPERREDALGELDVTGKARPETDKH